MAGSRRTPTEVPRGADFVVHTWSVPGLPQPVFAVAWRRPHQPGGVGFRYVWLTRRITYSARRGPPTWAYVAARAASEYAALFGPCSLEAVGAALAKHHNRYVSRSV